MLFGAKLEDLEGKVGYREVMFKLGWAILFGHFVALYSEMLSPSRTKLLKRLLRAMLAPVGVKVRVSYGHIGAMLAPISPILGLCSKLYGIILDMLLRHRQKQPKDTPPKRSPLWPSSHHRRNTTKTIKTHNLLQNANPHGRQAKT